jgi:hypothetical protein
LKRAAFLVAGRKPVAAYPCNLCRLFQNRCPGVCGVAAACIARIHLIFSQMGDLVEYIAKIQYIFPKSGFYQKYHAFLQHNRTNQDKTKK